MTDARDFRVEETLKNGLRVTVRAIRADDAEALHAAFRELDERTVYLRFFAPKQHISPRELKEATDIDFETTVALVACLPGEAGERIIAAARYHVFGSAEPPDRAEVAFTVEEDYHGLGIASLMLRHLAGIARRKGISRFHADVLAQNKGMLAVFKRSGFPMQQEYEDGVAHVTLSLGGSGTEARAAG